MGAKRAHIVLAQHLIAEIDRVVGKRQRSEFLAEAATRELLRQKQLRALQQTAGAWKASKHPELKRGSALFVRRMRAENERRIKRLRREG